MTIIGKDDVTVYGDNVGIAFERLYDRIAKGFYHKNTVPSSRCITEVCDQISKDYKDEYFNYVQLYKYIGESDMNFTKDKLYYVETYIENDKKQYKALNDNNERIDTDIKYFNICEERTSLI